MDFMWPARRREARETTEALLLATGLTALVAFAVASPHVRRWNIRPYPSSVAPRSAEVVTYVLPPAHAPPFVPRPTLSPAHPSVPAVDPADAATRAGDGAALGAAIESPPVADSARRAAIEPPAKPVAGPVIAPLGYARPAGPLVMRLLPGGSTIGDWRLVGKDEQAGLVSEERKRFEDARLIEPADVAARGGGASITTGWLGPGPTREERRRDSAIHAGNLRRLAALAARAQARLDSIRADSIARLPHPPRTS